MSDANPFARFEDGRGLAQAIVDTIREPLLVLDKDLRVVAASRSFHMIFKMSKVEVQGKLVYEMANGQWNIPELRLLLEKILPDHSVMDAYEVEADFAGMGHRSMLLNARTVVFKSHEGQMILLAMQDVTERRAAEQIARELLAEKEILAQEMQHRVGNSLQIVASILLLKARAVQSEEIRSHLHDAHRRVMSVAAVQQQLQASGHGDAVELAPYLTRLCETLAGSMIGDTRPITLKAQVESGSMLSNEAVSLGLIVTELVINALKHAFPGEAGGEIVVAYEADGPLWRLAVTDNGGGMPAIASKPGLGTSIVEALSRQLHARVQVSSSSHGTQVSITSERVAARLVDVA